MPKQYSIKWRKADLEKARRAVKNFNAKIDYWAKKDPESAEYLPSKLNFKQLKKEIKTREDFNKRMKELQGFSKKGAQKIVSIPGAEPGTEFKLTAWELKNAQRRFKKINEMRKKEAEMAEAGVKKRNGAQYQTAKTKAAKQRGIPEEFKKPKDRTDWENFLKRLRQSRWRSETGMLNIYKDRLELAITTPNAGYTPEQQKELLELIRKLSYQRCMQLYYGGEEALDPDWIYYDPTPNERKVRTIKKIILKELGSVDFIIEAVRKSNLSEGQKQRIITAIRANAQQVLDDYLNDMETSVFDPEYIQSNNISADIKYAQLCQALGLEED